MSSHRLYLALFAMVSVILLGACTEAATPMSSPSPTTMPTAPPGTPTPTPAPVPSPTPAVTQNPVLSTVEIAKLLRPSVVHIQTEAVQLGSFMQPVPVSGVGTGIVLDTEGHILTNNHVVEDATRITVSLSDDRSFNAEVVGLDPLTDLAVIRIGTDGLTPARLGDSSRLQVGEDVVAIGHALDLSGGPTVSKGVVSALDRSIQVDPQTTVDGLIQIDAAINLGNSGGPLVNDRGEVVGISTAIIPESRGIGFAININDAKLVMAQLIERGFVERAFLGIVHLNITPGMARNFGLPVDYGVGINSVSRGTPAERAGLMAQDILVQIGDQPLKNTADLIRFLTIHKPGETVEVAYYRNGARQTTLVTLGTRPRQ